MSKSNISKTFSWLKKKLTFVEISIIKYFNLLFFYDYLSVSSLNYNAKIQIFLFNFKFQIMLQKKLKSSSNQKKIFSSNFIKDLLKSKMEQDLEVAQAYVASKNYESAFNILHTLGTFCDP